MIISALFVVSQPAYVYTAETHGLCGRQHCIYLTSFTRLWKSAGQRRRWLAGRLAHLAGNVCLTGYSDCWLIPLSVTASTGMRWDWHHLISRDVKTDTIHQRSMDSQRTRQSDDDDTWRRSSVCVDDNKWTSLLSCFVTWRHWHDRRSTGRTDSLSHTHTDRLTYSPFL